MEKIYNEIKIGMDVNIFFLDRYWTTLEKLMDIDFDFKQLFELYNSNAKNNIKKFTGKVVEKIHLSVPGKANGADGVDNTTGSEIYLFGILINRKKYMIPFNLVAVDIY